MTVKKIAGGLALALISLSLHAATPAAASPAAPAAGAAPAPTAGSAPDCDALFAVLPDHSKDNNAHSQQAQKAMEDCDKQFPSSNEKADNPNLDKCLGDTFTKLSDSGNYLAAEQLGYNACRTGNMADAKKYITAITTNPKAPQEEKDKAAQLLKSLGQ